MEFNPLLVNRFFKSESLRRTKTDKVDAQKIALYLYSRDYKPNPNSSYHLQCLKSLTRLRESLVDERSLQLVRLTNIMDKMFPEFKPFFNERFSKTALYLLENYGSAENMSAMNETDYNEIRRISHGKFSPQQFLELKRLAYDTVGLNNSIFDVSAGCFIANPSSRTQKDF